VAETWDPAGTGVMRLPSGRLVRGRGLRRPPVPGPEPTFAVYLLGAAPPPTAWPSRWVRCPDFWVPRDWADLGTGPLDRGLRSAAPAGGPERANARDALREAWERAAGGRVEVGCGGGLGRTGTALACLAVIDGVPAHEAVAYVRRYYHPRAVETPWQRRFVRRFGRD
jgi:hypothetical protein